MTPQRAREIRIHWLTQVSPGERSYDQVIEQAILAACKEERHAALTEAAEMVERRGNSYKGFYPEAQACRTECEQIAATIESLRDQPKE